MLHPLSFILHWAGLCNRERAIQKPLTSVPKVAQNKTIFDGLASDVFMNAFNSTLTT